MKYKFESWHLIIALILLFFIASKYGGFLGALTGICTSVEPSPSEIKSQILEWEFGSVVNEDGELIGATVKSEGGGVYSWAGEYKLYLLDVTSAETETFTCADAINDLMAQASMQDNSTLRTFFEGDRKVFAFENGVFSLAGFTGAVFTVPKEVERFVWCDKSGYLLLSTETEGLKDKYFQSFYKCVDCESGVIENKTCPNGEEIIWRQCGDEGFWEVLSECPAPVVETPSSSGLVGGGGTIPAQCGPGEMWSGEEHKCVTLAITPDVSEDQPSQFTVFIKNPLVIVALAIFALGIGYFFIFRKKR